MTSPRTQGSMLEKLYKETGIPMAKHFGVTYPEYFTHPAAEYNAQVAYAGVIDLTHWTILRVTGADRTTFLNAMLTNDVSALETDEGCHTLITTTKGKIIAELYVFVRADDVIVLVSQGDAAGTEQILQKHIIMEDVTIEDISNDFGLLAIEGPKAYDCLWRMFPTGPFPKDNLHAVARQFEHIAFYVMKNTVTGDEGYHLMIPAADLVRMRSYLVQAARGSDGLAVGRIAWNMRRLENGLPWYGFDFTDANFPNEARFEDTVSYSKGCFLGQETLARLMYRGHVNRLLVGLAVEDDNWSTVADTLTAEFTKRINNYDEIGLSKGARPFATALDLRETYPRESQLFLPEGDSKSVGQITSAVYSPALERPLLLGYVHHDHATPGNRLVLKGPKTEYQVRITDLPTTTEDFGDTS